MEHIFVFDDDITMDVIIYDSTLKGRPSQISGIWRWKISFLQTMMTECLICEKKRIISLLMYKETLFHCFFIIGCSFLNCYRIIYRIMISEIVSYLHLIRNTNIMKVYFTILTSMSAGQLWRGYCKSNKMIFFL